MMDIYCPTCTEPFDLECLHEEAAESHRTYDQVAADFRKRGCHALEAAFGPATYCKPVDSQRALAAQTLYELLGDDMDGMASMMEDFEYMGMLD